MELLSWSLMAIALGAADGAVVGVMLKSLFASAVAPRTLNYSVALLLGAPHFCNLLGFAWPKLSRGRDALPLLFRIQLATALCLLLIAGAPLGDVGLPLMLAGALGARFFWSGVVTLRAPIWRATYPASTRARLTGAFFSAHSIMMALTALTVSSILDWNRAAYPAIFTIAAAIGVAGAVLFRRAQTPAAVRTSDPPPPTRADDTPGAWHLRNDPAFARYLFWLSTVHIGNLMMLGPLIAIMTDRLHLTQRAQVSVTSFIPLLLVPLAVPAWSRLFDDGTVLRFQMLNAAAFALAALALLTGAAAAQSSWLWIGAVLLGVAYAGGSIGWHLGHNHFSPRTQSLDYMGLHTTLSGVRGLVAPLLGMTLYEAIETLAPGRGAWALLIPLLLCAAGTLGFARMATLERRTAHLARLPVLIAVLAVLNACTPPLRTQTPPQAPAAESPRQPQRYLIYCPCMGRFGNQVDHLLGAMSAAHASGRTLVLPPFIEYEGRETRFVPFEKYFSLAAVRELVPAVTMEQFMLDPALAPSLWPPEQRRLSCPRGNEEDCPMPKGNPATTFWEHYGIAFVGSAALDEKLPVIALTDSPGRYPVAAKDRDLQRYLRWSDEIRRDGEAFVAEKIARPYLAVHLRNGTDWQQACRNAEGRRQYMSSPQCGLSDAADTQTPAITQDICIPGPDEVVRSIRVAQQRFGGFRSVFIGTDNDDYRPQIEAALGDSVKVVRGGAPQLDLYVFGQADLFIGNCVSSFTSFAVRERNVHHHWSMFFGFDTWTEGGSVPAGE